MFKNPSAVLRRFDNTLPLTGPGRRRIPQLSRFVVSFAAALGVFTCIYIGAVLRLVAGKQRIMRIPRVVRRRRSPAGSW